MTSPNSLARAAEIQKLLIEFSDFINEPPQYEDMRMVRDYRHEAARKWIPLYEMIAGLLSPAPGEVDAQSPRMDTCPPRSESVIADQNAAVNAPGGIGGESTSLPSVGADMVERAREWLETYESGPGFIVELGPNDRNVISLAALLSQSAAGGGWRPIESASKDGTPFLGFHPTHYQGKGGQHVTLWLNGWKILGYTPKAEPTHWQPLPAPPTPEAKP